VVKLYLLGTPRIERDGTDAGLGLHKAQALVAYLAVEGQPQRRDSLAALFWPENDQSGARANLRRCLYRVKQSLGEELLEVGQETVEIAPRADLWVDACEFQRSLEKWLPATDAPLDSLDPECQA